MYRLSRLCFVLVALAGRPSIAETAATDEAKDPATVAAPAKAAVPLPASDVTKPSRGAPAMASTKSAAPICPRAIQPVYVADWARLAALTQSDALVFQQVDGLAQRHDLVRQLSVSGNLLGGLGVVLGASHALLNDGWSGFDKWSVGGGLGLVAVSLFVAWAFEPDRDDFFTLINQWNLRHPQQALAP
jgi:hypothetical protein